VIFPIFAFATNKMKYEESKAREVDIGISFCYGPCSNSAKAEMLPGDKEVFSCSFQLQ